MKTQQIMTKLQIYALCPFHENDFSGCWNDEDISDDDHEDLADHCLMAKGETSEVRPYNCNRCNELQDILDSALKESVNEIKRLNREKKDRELNLEVCELERDNFKEQVQELLLQINGLHKSTGHSSVRSNQPIQSCEYTGKRPTSNTSRQSKSTCKSVTNEQSATSCYYYGKFGHKYSNYRFCHNQGWVWRPKTNTGIIRSNQKGPK